MMNQVGGWMNGGTGDGGWILIALGVLVVVMLAVVITRQFSTKP